MQSDDITDDFCQIVTKDDTLASRVPPLSNPVRRRINFYFHFKQMLMGFWRKSGTNIAAFLDGGGRIDADALAFQGAEYEK